MRRGKLIKLAVVDHDLGRSAARYAVRPANGGSGIGKELAVAVSEIHGLPWDIADLAMASASRTVSKYDSRIIEHVMPWPGHD